jgi:hypothetical protein
VEESILAHSATHHQRPFAADRIDGNIDPTIARLLVRFVPVGMHNSGSAHAPDITVMVSFVAPTIGFKLLYALVIVRLNRRDLVWINVTTNPSAEWVARQLTEAFPWGPIPRVRCRANLDSDAFVLHDQ